MSEQSRRILTINTGSSSLRAGLYDAGSDERLVLSADADRIGLQGGRLRIANAEGQTLLEEQRDLPGHAAALEALFEWITQNAAEREIDAAGHRVVHGGSHFTEPQPIKPALLDELKQLVRIAPNHLPQAIDAIQAVARRFPSLAQFACFDTAFHRAMPPVAQRYPLPRRFAAAGVVRYGFHGLSYEFVMEALRAQDGAAADGRVIIAHLGNGASMAAVHHGTGQDTTMGFTPTGGLMMGTRTGDLDPGILLYLLQGQGMAPAALSDLLNKQAGLLGVSGTSSDMRALMERESTDAAAAEAIELFCYIARKHIGALAAALGGLETLVFTAGIGERAVEVRRRICAELAFLGVQLDADRNGANAAVISAAGSAVTVRVIPTDENRMIARHTLRLLQS